MNGYIQTVIQPPIATITFFHPQSNSLTSLLLKELNQAIQQVSKQKNVYVLVIQSEGDRAFCAGASFSELTQLKDEKEAQVYFMGFGWILNALRQIDQIVVCGVQGKTVGGGVGIVAAVDYAFAVEEASIRLSELSIGIGPFVISPAVELKIGRAAFMELALNPLQWRSARWAQQKGLFNEVLNTKEEMANRVTHFLETLCQTNLQALSYLKKTARKSTSHWLDSMKTYAHYNAELVLTSFSQQAIKKRHQPPS